MWVPVIEWHGLALQLGVTVFSSPSGYMSPSSIKDTHIRFHSFSDACSALALAWDFLLKVKTVTLLLGTLFTFCLHPWGRIIAALCVFFPFPPHFSLLIPGCALSFLKLISPSKPHSLYSGLLRGRSNQTRKLTLQYRGKSPWHTLSSSSQPSFRWPTGEPASLLGIQKPESQSNLWMVSLT